MDSKRKKVNGRAKGASAERSLAKKFEEWWGTEFARTPMSGGFSTKKFREDWNSSGDLVTPDPSFPFCVESKKVEGWHLEQLLKSDATLIHSWWDQTVGETPAGKIPLLVFGKNYDILYIMIRALDWVKVMGWPSKAFLFEIDGQEVFIMPLSKLLNSAKGLWV